jgi:transcriptional regulator with XRE-family HTH domain
LEILVLDFDHYKDRLNELRGDLTVKQFAEKTGVPYGTLVSMMKGHMPGADKVIQIAHATGSSIDWLLLGKDLPNVNNDLVRLPIYDVRASAGAGALVTDDYLDGEMPFNPRWLRGLGVSNVNNLAIIHSQGDSMTKPNNEGIAEGDMLIVDMGVTDLPGSGIYVLEIHGKLLVKRLQLLGTGAVNIISDNPAYPVDRVEANEAKFITVLGRVVWHGRHLL